MGIMQKLLLNMIGNHNDVTYVSWYPKLSYKSNGEQGKSKEQ